MNSYILTFKNTHAAMEEEKNLLNHGETIKMIPTPRGISSECGFSIRVQSNDINITEKLTIRKNAIERIYLLYQKQRRKHYEEIYRR